MLQWHIDEVVENKRSIYITNEYSIYTKDDILTYNTHE